MVGVPGTIDNDIVCTDYTIGFDTAANTAVECIDRLRDTMQSHERCSVVEVMGRHAGYLALYVGVAVGATAVLVPEHQYDFEKHVAEKIRAARLGGKTNFMIVVAEGAASAMDVGKEIKEHLGLDPVSPFWATSSGAAVPPPRIVCWPPAWGTRRCGCWPRA